MRDAIGPADNAAFADAAQRHAGLPVEVPFAEGERAIEEVFGGFATFCSREGQRPLLPISLVGDGLKFL